MWGVAFGAGMGYWGADLWDRCVGSLLWVRVGMPWMRKQRASSLRRFAEMVLRLPATHP